MKYSLVEVVELFEIVQKSYPKIIRSFYFGDIQYYPQKGLLPCLMLTPTPGSMDLDTGFINMGFSLSLFDKLTEDQSNLKYVLDNCLNDLITILNMVSDRIDLKFSDVAYETGISDFSEGTGGITITFTIQNSMENCEKRFDDIE